MYKLLQPEGNQKLLRYVPLPHAESTNKEEMKSLNKDNESVCTGIRSKTQIKAQYPLIFTAVCNSGQRVKK